MGSKMFTPFDRSSTVGTTDFYGPLYVPPVSQSVIKTLPISGSGQGLRQFGFSMTHCTVGGEVNADCLNFLLGGLLGLQLSLRCSSYLNYPYINFIDFIPIR